MASSLWSEPHDGHSRRLSLGAPRLGDRVHATNVGVGRNGYSSTRWRTLLFSPHGIYFRGHDLKVSAFHSRQNERYCDTSRIAWQAIPTRRPASLPNPSGNTFGIGAPPVS